jgi:hypothetical protein
MSAFSKRALQDLWCLQNSRHDLSRVRSVPEFGQVDTCSTVSLRPGSCSDRRRRALPCAQIETAICDRDLD